jgi:ATP-binding cassette, subfamily B, bacterial MsbA
VKKDLQVYRRLLKYLIPFWGLGIVVFLGFAVSASTEVAVAKLLEKIITAIQHRDTSFTAIFPVLVVVMVFLRGAGQYVGSYYTAVISRHLVFNVRKQVFAKILRLPSQYFLDNTSGHITAKIMFNVEQLTAATTESLRTLIQQGLITIGLFGFMIYTNWRLTLCILVFAPVIGVLVRKAGKRMRRLSVQVQDTMGDVNHVVQETVNANAVVKGFAGQDKERERFEWHSMENLKRGLKMTAISQLNTPMVQIVLAFAMGIIIWIALRPEILQDISAGEFVAYITAAGMLSKPIKALTDVNEKFQRGLAGAHSVFELLDLEEEKNTGTLMPKLAGNVKFEHVSMVYPDGYQAIHDFNLEVKAGQTVALVGRSGAGKSTLVNLLVRFQDISQGQLLLDNLNINDIEVNNLRSQIAMVSQQVVLFNRSIRENIAYGQLEGSSLEDVIAAAKAAFAHDFIMALPDGYDTVLGAQGLNLSGGQRQRIAIARAILKNAPILILDEATSALDNESEYFIQQAFDSAMADRTTIVIAHRLSTIENADLIVVMDKGRILETGTHQELLSKEGVYFQLHQRNFEE